MEFLILQGTRGEKYFGRHCSEKKYPPLKKTSVDDDLQQVIEERWRKLCFEDGIIKIPDSVEMTVSWEKAFHSFPDTRIKVGRFFKRPCLLTDQNGMSNSDRGPTIDASYHVSE